MHRLIRTRGNKAYMPRLFEPEAVQLGKIARPKFFSSILFAGNPKVAPQTNVSPTKLLLHPSMRERLPHRPLLRLHRKQPPLQVGVTPQLHFHRQPTSTRRFMFSLRSSFLLFVLQFGMGSTTMIQALMRPSGRQSHERGKGEVLLRRGGHES